MTRLALVPHGAPALAALRDAVAAAKAHDPLAPVTVAVPSTYAGLSLRRDPAGWGGDGGLVNVRFLSLNRVAELLGAPFLAQPDRVPLTREMALEAVRAALAEAPGVFSGVRGHPSLARSLLATFADLRAAPDETLGRLADVGERTASVVALYRAYRHRIAHCYDDEDQLHAAAHAVRDGSSGLDDLGTLIVHLPREVTTGGRAVVAALADRGRAAAVLGLTGDDDADAPVRRLCDELAAVLGPPREEGAVAAPPNAILSAPDPDEEVRAVVREIRSRAAEHGASRVAIAYRVPEPHARLVHEHLVAAGIPCYGPSITRLADTAAGRTLGALLELAAHDFRRDDVLAFLATAPIREKSGGERVPASRWDALSRRAGIVRGLDQWEARLAAWRDREPSDRDDETAATWLARDREQCERILTFVRELGAELAEEPTGSWSAAAAWATGLLDRYLGTPGHDWPDNETAALERVRGRLGTLASLEGTGTPPPDRREFRRALAEELDVSLGHVGRFGEGVFVGPVAALAGQSFDALFLVGMSEGSAPPPPRDDPLLPDRERADLLGVPTRRADYATERAEYLAALATAPAVTLSFPRGDPRDERAVLPSRWVAEAASCLAGERVGAETLARAGRGQQPWLDVIESFAASAGEPSAGAASIAEFDLRTLTRFRRTGQSPGTHVFATTTPALAAGYATIAARVSDHFTEYDGVLGAHERFLPDPERPVSATALETWAVCPFKYLLRQVLRVTDLDRPEDVERISPLDRGTLVHAVLDEFVADPASARSSPDQPWSASDRQRLRTIAERRLADAEAEGRTGRPLLWRFERERTLRELDAVLDDDELVRARSRAVPFETEVAFGAGEEMGALALEIGDRTVCFRGHIDRLDLTPEGRAAFVYDYKTGSRDDFAALEDDRVLAGRKLQLAVYGLAVQRHLGGVPVESAYWFTRDAGDPLVRIPIDDETEARLVGVLDIITGAIADGAFPAYSGDYIDFFGGFAGCRNCEYDRLCPMERDRAFRRRRDDPAIAAFVTLREPDEQGSA